MTPAQLDEARRWVALRGWRWMPGMVAVRQRDSGAIRVCDVEVLTAEDIEKGRALAEALNSGALVLPGTNAGASYQHVGEVGDARGLVGIGHPVAYEEDEDGGLWPAFMKTSVAGWLPDLTDPATRGCLLELARQITGRPDLVAGCLPGATGWVAGAWAGGEMRPLGDVATTEAAALLAACERHERTAPP